MIICCPCHTPVTLASSGQERGCSTCPTGLASGQPSFRRAWSGCRKLRPMEMEGQGSSGQQILALKGSIERWVGGRQSGCSGLPAAPWALWPGGLWPPHGSQLLGTLSGGCVTVPGGRQRPCPCSQLGHWRAGGLRGPSSCITGCQQWGLETMGFLLSHFQRREGWDARVGSPRAL